MIRLSSEQIATLNSVPEYRMGYHKVHARIDGSAYEFGYILNQTIFVPERENLGQNLDWESLLKEAAKTRHTVSCFRVIPREPETLRGVRQIALNREKWHVLAERTMNEAQRNFSARSELMAKSAEYANVAKSEEARDAPITLTIAGEIFKRFCAYANDRRLTAGMGYRPGTFATTKEDADANIKTGTDAVGRYALPDSKPASNVFTISPKIDTDLQRGTVAPANGQLGGGVEVIFVNGTPDGTVTGPNTISDR